ncbi:hypothetical protein AX15_006942 [Amanita polypyramis BW_CC]|nr:hypothetical protein AX15_006942 [Amanita polypyramis BW_CC]
MKLAYIEYPSIDLPVKTNNIWTGNTISITPKPIWRYLGFFFDSELNFDTRVQRYINKSMSALNAMRMLGNSVEGFTPSKRKQVYNACIWTIATYGAPLWYRKNGKGVKDKTSKLDKVKNTAMRWISGVFSTMPITALELITNTAPTLTQLNITIVKYLLRINKLSDIHPCRRLACTIQFQTLNHFRINIIPSAYENKSTFNLCRNSSLITDECFTYIHTEQIKGHRIMDLYNDFKHYDHPKKGSDLFSQWFIDFNTWLNTIRNDKDHILISTDGSYIDHAGTAAYTIWCDQNRIIDFTKRIPAHSSFDAGLQAIQLAFEALTHFKYRKVTILVDNESAAKSIWNTNFHNLQYVSINAMTNIRHWIDNLNGEHFSINVLWCPAHMDVLENEVVDKLATDAPTSDRVTATTLNSKITEVRLQEIKAWDGATRKYNALGHEYLCLKYKHKRISPTIGSRKNAFYVASKDNIILMAKLTRIIMNHAPTGEY